MPWLRPISLREQGGHGSRRRHCHFFSNLLIKLIEPTFSKKQKQKLIFMCAQKMKRKVKGKSVRRYSKKLPFIYPSMFHPILDGPTFSGKKNKKLELNTREPSYCYSTKISMVSGLWKGHQVEKTVGAFKTRSHFPTPELSWTPQKKKKKSKVTAFWFKQ